MLIISRYLHELLSFLLLVFIHVDVPSQQSIQCVKVGFNADALACGCGLALLFHFFYFVSDILHHRKDVLNGWPFCCFVFHLVLPLVFCWMMGLFIVPPSLCFTYLIYHFSIKNWGCFRKKSEKNISIKETIENIKIKSSLNGKIKSDYGLIKDLKNVCNVKEIIFE